MTTALFTAYKNGSFKPLANAFLFTASHSIKLFKPVTYTISQIDGPCALVDQIADAKILKKTVTSSLITFYADDLVTVTFNGSFITYTIQRSVPVLDMSFVNGKLVGTRNQYRYLLPPYTITIHYTNIKTI